MHNSFVDPSAPSALISVAEFARLALRHTMRAEKVAGVEIIRLKNPRTGKLLTVINEHGLLYLFNGHQYFS